MSVCSKPGCGADVTGQQWCLSCGSPVGNSQPLQDPEADRTDSGPSSSNKRNAIVVAAAAVGVLALAGGFTFALAGSGAEAEAVDPSIATPDVTRQGDGPTSVQEEPTEPIAPPLPVTTPPPPPGQSWEAIGGRPELLKTPVTSEEMANIVAAKYTAGQIAAEGSWITSPANGKRYLIQCSASEEPRTQHTSCLEIDNEDGGELDAGIVVLQ